MNKSTWVAAAGATALTAALVLTGATAASAAPVDNPPTVTCELGNVWSRLPAELRADIRQLRDLEPGEARAEAAKQIRDDVLAGDYGDGVQKRAEQVKEHGLRSVAKLWFLNNCD